MKDLAIFIGSKHIPMFCFPRNCLPLTLEIPIFKTMIHEASAHTND